jgi:hypothetical protein
MSRKLFGVIALCVISMLESCTVVVTKPTETTIKAENDLTSMSVDVNGTTTNIDGIDLIKVTIGDVIFPYIDYGTTSATQVTNKSGDVTIYIDTAVVSAKFLGSTVYTSFPNITPMSATILPDQLNTVVFDHNTANMIFQALAKKKVPLVN